jgi:hypothetical protein
VGGISAHLGAGALAARLAQQRGGDGRGRRRGAGPTRQRGGVNGVDGHGRRGGRFDRSPADGEIPRWFSAVGPVLRRGGGGEARAGAVDHGGGVNLTGGAYGDRSVARWRVSTAARSPVPQLGAIGGGEVCLVTVIVWRSSSTSLI